MANNQIALLSQVPEFDTPLQSQAKAMQIRNLMNQGQVQDMDMQDRRQKIERMNGLRTLMSGFKPDATTDDQVGALTRGGYLTEARSLAESSAKVNTDKRAAEKAELEGHFKKYELVGQIMGGVKDQATYDIARQDAARILGPEAAAQMPPQYNPDLIEQRRAQAQTRIQQLEQMWKQKGFDREVASDAETVRHNKSQEGITMRGQNMVDARAKDQNENGRGVIIQTDEGPMLANSKTGATKPIIGPDGKPVTRTKPLTEFQGKSAAFGDRAMAADAILGKIGDDYSPAGINYKNAAENFPLIGGTLGTIGNVMLSDNSQQVDQAKRDFINATLRQESGAAIGVNEFSNAEKQYFPQPGDSQAVIRQKADNRKLVIAGFKRSAGANAEFSNAQQKPAAKPSLKDIFGN